MAKLNPPKGTRDFYPDQMAWHQHLLDAWRRVSVRNGFDQVEGPVFETLELYKVKSGDGIVSELFSFRRANGKTDFALRPEFTPTLARMVAAKANSLPRPIKWFCTPNACRAERPQRGRLREFWQWNVDLLGLDGPGADAEVVFTLLDFLQEVGLKPNDAKVKLSHRDVVAQVLAGLGLAANRTDDAFKLLDGRDKMEADAFAKQAAELGLDAAAVERFTSVSGKTYAISDVATLTADLGLDAPPTDLVALIDQLTAFGVAEWCEIDLGIVRGLAYYTGTVFEVHETGGKSRALAGGGRYDKLIELFGGPAMPAVGFGMGDVVLTNLLEDKGLLPEHLGDRPDAFVMATDDAAANQVAPIVAQLRRAGRHARMSYKTTRSVGKLLKDAEKTRARFAVLVSADGLELKDLASGEQQTVAADDLVHATA